MEFQEGICRLCLKEREHCRSIDENTTNILSMLLPKTDFAVIQGPVICRNCADMLTRCYDFKAMCLHTYKSIVPLINKDSVKLNLKDFYLSKNPTATGVPDDQDICGFCVGLIKNLSAASLFVLDKMTIRCLPELDLSIIEKLVICPRCLGSLENCFRFLTNCLIAEENIQKYCDALDVDPKGAIELSNVLHFTIRRSTNQVSGNWVNGEQRFCDNRKSPDEKGIGDKGDIIKLEETFVDDGCEHAIEDVEIKNEILLEMDYENDEHRFTSKNMLTLEEGSDVPDFVKTERLRCEENEAEHKGQNLAEMEDQTSLLNEEVEIKTEDDNFNRFKDDNVLSQTEGTTLLLRKQENLTSDLAGDKITPYVNETLTNHLQKYEKVKLYQCDICPFSTELKTSFKVHLLKHDDPLEATMYQCDSCSYQTKCKRYLKSHSLKHNDASEVTMYKCASCSFQSKHRRSLRNHLLKHRDPSEVTMFQCDLCSYQTKSKRDLKSHSLKHKDPSEVTMYQCDLCSYQSKYKQSLKAHSLMHKDPSEVTVFKCEQCLFQTKHKHYLKKHLLTHKEPSQETVHKCGFCLYQTSCEDNLKNHLLKHPSEVTPEDASEVTTYKCDYCLYQTIYKYYLKQHLLKHKDASEVTMYRCDTCLYQTKYIGDLKRHLVNHGDPSALPIYKCDTCSFQTVHKYILKNHLVKHKDPSEVTMYKCDHCSYESKYKRCLKRHFMTHKNSCK